MKEKTPIGLNRTGIQMSPFDINKMLSAQPSNVVSTSGDETALVQLRGAYIAASEPIGSVPVPGTIKGALTTAVSMLTGSHPEVFIDKLGERLAFERTGTRLYEALMIKHASLQDASISMTADDLRQIRNDEARHFLLVADAIESLGADPTAQTPCADVAGVEAQGLLQVVVDPRTTLAQSLHAILVAEMADNSGWEMLIALAESHGQQAMVTDFMAALHEEQRHLSQVRTWFEEATLGKAITQQATVH